MKVKEIIKAKTESKKQKKNDFKINLIFDNKGESLNTIIERAFSNYWISKKS